MLFNSLQFLCFLPIVLIVYYYIPNKIKYLWLLAASYYFYMCWNAEYALLLLFSTAVTYICSLGVSRMNTVQSPYKSLLKKIIIASGLIINFLILFFFKYFNFVAGVIENALSLLNIQMTVSKFDVLLPVGISFYTFQAVGYMIDVYRNDVEAEKNFFRYALFVSFFPQLVAGPIERSKNLLHQLKENHKFDFLRAVEGLLIMIWGFFLKIVIADRAAVFVDKTFSLAASANGMHLIIAVLLFSIQIYCDFYGYSTIAIGSAKILGINLMDNFNAPYLSTSVSGFWRNWHISLTSWFKDYLYIPLGGSRKGIIRKYLNKMIVFLCSGLWHGASLSFVAWGAINGLYQIFEEAIQSIGLFQRRKLFPEKIQNILAMARTFILINITWIFFRADRMKTAFLIIKKIICNTTPNVLLDGSLFHLGLDRANFCLLLICIGVLLFADICKKRGLIIHKWLMNKWFCWFVIAISIYCILLFGIWGPQYTQASFIYFQF